MKKKLLETLENWTKYYLSISDLVPILGCSPDAIHSLIKRAVKEKILIRIKRDFYLISKKIQKKKPESYEIASLLYGPSYISFENSLNYHGWIPESVQIINSATTKRTKKFENILGIFAYYNIPVNVFHIGVSSIHNHSEDSPTFLIADPWKAIADLIYLKKRTWPNIIALSNDLRIELDVLQNSDLNLLKKLAEIYPNKRVQKMLNIFIKDLNI